MPEEYKPEVDQRLNILPNSVNSFTLKNRPVLLGILAFTVMASLTGILVYQRFLIKKENKKDETHEIVIAAKEKLQDLLTQSAAATKTLAFFVQPDGSVKEFDPVCAHIRTANPSIDVLELIPEGVIRYIYPQKGNESALGYNVLNDTFRTKQVPRAILKKELFFTGPFILKQGGIGVISSLPLFRNNKFWGFSAVIIKISTLLKVSGIDSATISGYYFQLSKINPDTGEEEFFTSKSKELHHSNEIALDVPGGEWKLSATPVNERKEYIDILWLGIVGLLFSIMCGWITLIATKRPEKLNRLVKIRTAELAKSEKKYRSLIEQASDGIVISDLTGVITEVNNSICALTGYAMEEMLGRHINNFMPGKDVIEKPLRIENLLEGKTLQYERRIQKKDGTVVDVEVNSKMASGDMLIGFVRDITERKKADRELKKSNERFELTARATNDAIWDYDFIKNEIVGNENLYTLYGITPDQHKISFDSYTSKLHPADRDRMLANFEKSIAEKAISVTNEIRFKIPDGSYTHLYDRAYIKYDESGRPVRAVGVMQDITARIHNRQRLLREKELSDSIINSLPAVFYLYNKEGRFLRWNKNFEIVTGYSAEEISTLHPLDLFDEQEKKLLKEKIQNVFISGQDNVEANFLLKNGEKIPYYFSGMQIDYEGESCLLGFGLDFSDKVQSDKLIKESEQKFRGLVEQATDGVAITSENGTHLYVSPAVKRILGYSESEMKELNAFSLIHPEDIAALAKVFEKVMQNPGVPVKGHIARMTNKTGSWCSLEMTFTNMLHIPSLNGIVENFRDITEKLEIEKKIITEKDLSDSIINSLPGIFYLYDNTGRFIRWNKNFEAITGYTSEEIRQMHPLDFYDKDLQPVVAQRIHDVFQRKMPAVEFPLMTKQGKKIPFLYNSISIEYEGVPSVAGMAFDVTERKKIEQQLLVSNQHLEQKAIELKTSYSELERFAYIVSHDLQEPLRMVSSFLKLLEQKYKPRLDETGEKYIHFAVDGANRMKQLITDLLEYSRTGTNKDIPVDTDMNEVMKGVLDLFENLIREQHAAITIEHLPILPATSKIQMFQLMQNLLSNALKYHSDRPPVIHIGAREETDQWVFSMQDNGIGIHPKFSERIFIIFQRLHNKNEYSGTGIGLSICKKIVEKHGGKIWVEPAAGTGSIFYFTILKNVAPEPRKDM